MTPATSLVSSASSTTSDDDGPTVVYRYEHLDWSAKYTAQEHSGVGEQQVESVSEMFARDLEELGFTGLEARWSLIRCQGDGVAFEGSVDDITDVTDPEFLPILAMLGANKETAVVNGRTVSWPRPIQTMRLVIENRDSHYTHWNTFVVMCYPTYDDEGEDVDWDGSEPCLDDGHPVDAAILQYFQNLSRKFEKDGYSVFEDEEWWDSVFEENCFDSDGRIECDADDIDGVVYVEFTPPD